jgi:hypothetical protein
MFSMTVIASTADQFSDFTPYVASVNDAGTVAFQAALQGGGTGLFTGSGGSVARVAGPDLVAAVTSHPDLNGSGVFCFYGKHVDGAAAIFLVSDGQLRSIANAGGAFAGIGPLGPTMNEAGMVAFRADRTSRVSGIYVGDGAGVAGVAETGDRWSRFHGLPVISESGTVVFRADRKDGVQGIYAAAQGSIRTIAETGDVFESLAHFPSVNDHATVAFAATLRSGGAGVFSAGAGGITQAGDTDGPYEGYRGALIADDGRIVRIATPLRGRLGLFGGPDPEADRILALGDALLGSTVTDFAANPVSVSGAGHVAIRATLTDGRQLILRAEAVD